VRKQQDAGRDGVAVGPDQSPEQDENENLHHWEADSSVTLRDR